jgi:hypothetical protein
VRLKVKAGRVLDKKRGFLGGGADKHFDKALGWEKLWGKVSVSDVKQI